MNTKTLISVILPVYNAELYLDECLQSIINQSYKNLEIIIVNDGSSDRSLEIIKEYALIDKRIIVLDEPNSGIVSSLNKGIKVSSGDFIARMDSDDISLPYRLEKQLSYLSDNNLDVCGCHYFTIDKYGSIDGLKLVPISFDTIRISLATEVPFAHPSVLIRKCFLIKHKLYYSQSIFNKAEDYDLWVKMYTRGALFGNIDDVLFKYRILSNSLSRKNHKLILKQKKYLNNIIFTSCNHKIFNILKVLPLKLNYEEKSLIIRFLFRFSKFNLLFFLLRNISKFKFSLILRTLFSELRLITKI